jgi:HEPN domain-containing protein
MNESLFEEWIAKADDDFVAASSLDPERLPGVVCFHCQQCIEKYLKAALVRHGRPTHRTHNLAVLGDMAAEDDQEFASLNEGYLALNPYSVVVRYPGVTIASEDAVRALEITRRLRRQLRELLGLDDGR